MNNNMTPFDWGKLGPSRTKWIKVGREFFETNFWLPFSLNPKWQFTPVFLPVDGGAWWAAVHGVIQSWTQLKQLGMYACIGEGNGNPLQYSCLEYPMDKGAWWATVHGITKSWT